ncbi:segregation and condensation protein B [Bosea sp. BE271]|nr:segregation and condensation protein B [Bosea robiniae]MDR6894144.1 segregation and condensation protein B [Bosea sp. BE109]MDR7137539.1 segregation and condensation protein B [Bosea sp. BE168]MDR7174239.1 segregation and condensation protein B [Bosea sp. BE271]
MTGMATEPEDIETDGGAEAFSQALRVVEALLFASAVPLTAEALGRAIPAGIAIEQVLARLAESYALRGVNLRQVAGGWAFRTAPDLGYLLAAEAEPPRRLSRAALEVLSIIAYHQPVTRAEIEEIRGVATAKGTLDILLEAGWVRLRGRRRSPGRPITYGTTPGFLDHFGLDRIDDLPGLEELKGTGFIEGRLTRDLAVPVPDDDPGLRDDEDPLGDLFSPLDDGEGGSQQG